ncbi:MAG: DNA-formamidopyrimidine glycosylase family protein [Phycisphaerae bacterium]|nr:DNA-formamidopyrimidine glycosylase family protein [Phycisphaerae bacterium]
MPELPDIELYLMCMRSRVLDRALERVRITSPSLLRTFEPDVAVVEGRVVRSLARLGKRVVIGLDGDLYLVVHLMISGRLRWKAGPSTIAKPGGLASAQFMFSDGTLTLTETSTRKRASLHVVQGDDALRALDPGGIEPLAATRATFVERLVAVNRTIKRALTDPATIAGIGDAYSDEILHAAKLSPVKLTSRITDGEWTRLHEATQMTLRAWTARLQRAVMHAFPGPGDVTAFRPEFAAHGRFRQPCPVCGTAIQRIVRGDHETNYCPRCQTDGKLLADRSLSRLLKDDWPASMDAWEGM